MTVTMVNLNIFLTLLVTAHEASSSLQPSWCFRYWAVLET